MTADVSGRLAAALADRYRIERELGAGGMATVYLAQDLKHDRKVAVKVLRPELAAVIGGDRFLSEIKTTANLQHPHILPLFDSGAADGFLFYVMPFIEGESLRDRLNREKQLPINDAVRIASEVAGALDYAHRHGVIHRDIKPENILLHDGRALVADFGIALAASKAGGTRMTETGMSLGTPAYMSPEQAMGERDITAKSDVYALGCITYEMLVGDPPFTGSTAQAVVAKVLTEKPAPPSKSRDTVPDEIDDAVHTALAKLPADRWPTAAAFAEALRGGGGGQAAGRSGGLSRHKAPPARRPVRLTALVLALAGTAVLAAWGWLRARPHDTPAVVRFELQPSPGVTVAFPVTGVATQVALSPDGRLAAYAAGPTNGTWRLYLRNLDRLVSRALPGTDGALNPEFSPDGRWIAFRSPDGKLKKIAVDGSTLTTVCAIDNSGSVGAGITWISDREIVFARGTYSEGRGLWRVSSDGGDPVQFSQLDSASGERLQLSPRAAAQGRLVFYSSTVASNADLTIAVVRTATGKPTVFPALHGARAVGLVDGYLVYVRGDGALMAAPFDVRALRSGTPIQVADSIAVPSTGWDTPVALSPSGSLFYQHGGTTSQLVMVDAHGAARVLLDSAQVYSHPRLSPDGRRIAVEIQGATGADIWVSDLAEHTAERLTRDAYNNRPEWSPDGRRVMYTSSRAPRNGLWWQPADGSADPTMLLHGTNPIREGVFTPDGRSVVYREDTPANNRDIYLLPLGGTQKPVPLLVNINDDKEPRVSPDSKWLAYVSNETGREEVYLRSLSGTGGRVPVSVGGGGEPLWSRDGKKLYYRTGAKLIAATVATAPSLAVTTREVLFEGPYATDVYHPNYDVAPGGGFVMVRPVEEGRQLVVAVNWSQELRQRIGGSK
jgi:serine/threonine-protein kinase